MTSISKKQVDRLGDRLRKGQVSDADLRLLDAYRQSFAEAYEQVVRAIRSATGIVATGRPAKTKFSIIEKLRREKTMHLTQMQDIAGCRVVVDGIQKQDQVVESLTRALRNVRVVDRRSEPSHGYRAVHLIAKVRDKLVEIQVRSELQDLWAQQSEIMSDTTDPRIKYGGGDRDAQELLSTNSKWIAQIEEAEKELVVRKAGLAQNLKKLNEIFRNVPRKVN